MAALLGAGLVYRRLDQRLVLARMGCEVRRLPAFAAILLAAGIALTSRSGVRRRFALAGHPIALASGVPRPAGRRLRGDAARDDGGVVALLIGLLLGLPAPLILVDAYPAAGTALPGLWLYLIGLAFTAWCALDTPWRRPAATGAAAAGGSLAAPLLFGSGCSMSGRCWWWASACRRSCCPPRIRSAISWRAGAAVLWGDSARPSLKAVLAGWIAGCGLSSWSPSPSTGPLPAARPAAAGQSGDAVPVVGIAPIMVMWFGFDWPSRPRSSW